MNGVELRITEGWSFVCHIEGDSAGWHLDIRTDILLNDGLLAAITDAVKRLNASSKYKLNDVDMEIARGLYRLCKPVEHDITLAAYIECRQYAIDEGSEVPDDWEWDEYEDMCNYFYADGYDVCVNKWEQLIPAELQVN